MHYIPSLAISFTLPNFFQAHTEEHIHMIAARFSAVRSQTGRQISRKKHEKFTVQKSA